VVDGESFVRITNQDVWRMFNEMDKKLTNIEHKIEDQVEERVEIRRRVRSLELKFYGILAGLLGGLTMFAAVIVKGGS
jgi:hypothetical protein